MNELLFENIIEKESLENILAYNQIKKCDNEINKYTEEIEQQKEEMKNILKNENVDEEYVDKIHKYKSVLKNMCGDNSRITELDELIEKNEERINEFQLKITETEESMNELKENIFNTENPSEVIDCQNQIENLNVRLNDLNDILNQLISDNTPLLIEREYLIAKNGENDLNIPKYSKEEINKHLSILEEEFKALIEELDLPVRENIEFCQKKIKNRELEIEKFNQRKDCVINNYPNALKVDIENEYKNIETLLNELNLKVISDKETTSPSVFDEVIVEETEVEEVPEEISDYAENMIDEMGDLDFEEENDEVKEETVEVPVEETVETEDNTASSSNDIEETAKIEEENVDSEENEQETVEKTKEETSEVIEESTETEEVASVSYVLSDGESLSNIAEKVYPSKDNWLAIYYFNKDTIDKYLVSNGISNDIETVKELSNDTNLFTGIKLEIPTDYNFKI